MAGGGATNLARATATNNSSSSPKSQSTEGGRRHFRRQQPKRRVGRNSAIAEKERKPKEALDPTQAMIRIGQLKSTLSKAPDPPAVAAELAMLYLVLSDQTGALRSFQLAVKPSPGELGHPSRRDPERGAPIKHITGCHHTRFLVFRCVQVKLWYKWRYILRIMVQCRSVAKKITHSTHVGTICAISSPSLRRTGSHEGRDGQARDARASADVAQQGQEGRGPGGARGSGC